MEEVNPKPDSRIRSLRIYGIIQLGLSIFCIGSFLIGLIVTYFLKTTILPEIDEPFVEWFMAKSFFWILAIDIGLGILLLISGLGFVKNQDWGRKFLISIAWILLAENLFTSPNWFLDYFTPLTILTSEFWDFIYDFTTSFFIPIFLIIFLSREKIIKLFEANSRKSNLLNKCPLAVFIIGCFCIYRVFGLILFSNLNIFLFFGQLFKGNLASILTITLIFIYLLFSYGIFRIDKRAFWMSGILFIFHEISIQLTISKHGGCLGILDQLGQGDELRKLITDNTTAKELEEFKSMFSSCQVDNFFNIQNVLWIGFMLGYILYAKNYLNQSKTV